MKGAIKEALLTCGDIVSRRRRHSNKTNAAGGILFASDARFSARMPPPTGTSQAVAAVAAKQRKRFGPFVCNAIGSSGRLLIDPAAAQPAVILVILLLSRKAFAAIIRHVPDENPAADQLVCGKLVAHLTE